MRYVENSFNDAYERILGDLLSTPEHKSTNRKGEHIHEMIDAQFTILDPCQCFATLRKLSLDYLKGEMEFYLSGSPYLKDIVKHSKFWAKVTDDGETINSNYGKLLMHDKNEKGYTQFEYARDMLKRNSDSKKAVMSIYSACHAYKSNDNPCTMYLQFFIRDNKLDLYVKMRSSDVWFGLPYDVPFFVYIQIEMLRALRVTYPHLAIGTYNHQAGSMHLYERNFARAKEVLEEWQEKKKDRNRVMNEQTELFDAVIGGI